MAETTFNENVIERSELPAEREHFKELILGNPNHFGTFPQFGGKVVKKFSGNTTYEQLACLGLNQGSIFGGSLLEAVIHVKKPYGYGTNACGAGTTEHVRFYVEDSSGWHDLNSAAVQVFDLAGHLPLSYAVSIDFSEARKFCNNENIVHVRAILSWQLDPTPNDPNFIPVWGNVVDAQVQVEPRYFFDTTISELIASKLVTVDESVIPNINLNQSLPANAPAALTYSQLKSVYKDTQVPAHRYGFTAATKIVDGTLSKALSPVGAQSVPGTPPKNALPPSAYTPQSLSVGEELQAILQALEETSGDTSYEQLTCAGYNPQTRELEGVIQVKQGSGYSGSLCTAGSTEYVSFFAFVGGSWIALGTARVQVHDLKSVAPGKPISYAVLRISNLTSMPCDQLEGVPLRAILSWQTPPTGPYFTPVWGNVVDTYVQPQIAPGDGEEARLMRIGNVSIIHIDGAGFAPDEGSATITGDCNGNSSPFGGAIIVEGDFNPKIDVFDPVTGALLPGAKPIIYQAWATPTVGVPLQLSTPFNIEIYPPSAVGPLPPKLQQVGLPLGPVLGGVPGDKYFTYWESNGQAVNPRTLAVFEAGGLTEGDYTIELRGYKWDGTTYIPLPVQSKLIHVYNGYPHFELTTGGVSVPEQRPQVSITITAPSGDCGDVQVGDTITGNYSVTDEYFSSVSVALVGITVMGIPQPENTVFLSTANAGPDQVVYDGANTTGTSGTFTLDTTGMTPCGYNILLQAWDRALVDSVCTGHYNQEGVGFCLRKKES